MQNLLIPWSDNWWIEKGKAWFCAGEIGALFCVNMSNQQCECVGWIPGCSVIQYRQYSNCIKHGRYILFARIRKGYLVLRFGKISLG